MTPLLITRVGLPAPTYFVLFPIDKRIRHTSKLLGCAAAEPQALAIEAAEQMQAIFNRAVQPRVLRLNEGPEAGQLLAVAEVDPSAVALPGIGGREYFTTWIGQQTLIDGYDAPPASRAAVKAYCQSGPHCFVPA